VERHHAFAWGRNEQDTVTFGEEGLPEGVNESLVGGDQPLKADNQVVQ
jgi:hypothetical protein